MTPHAWSTNDSNGPGSLYREYISKTYMFPNCPTQLLKVYMNLKGLLNKKFSCMQCQWHRMHDFCVRKSIITRRIRNGIQKGFSPWIKGPGGIVWFKKTEGRKSRDTVPLNTETNVSCSACSMVQNEYTVLYIYIFFKKETVFDSDSYNPRLNFSPR
jgi:hypothetical protein